VVVSEEKAEKEKDKKEKGKSGKGKGDSDKRKKEKLEELVPKGELGSRALLTVELPADARLYIDGNLMTSVTSRRRIITPPLQAGQTYTYEVRVELIRNGQTLSRTQEVSLRPGEQTYARFANLESAEAAEDAADSQR
jgi:uncharacterized protein (TIGR03000 family)